MKKIFMLAFLAAFSSVWGQTNFERNNVISLLNGDHTPSGAVAMDVDGDAKIDIITTGGTWLMWYKNLDGQGNFSIGKPIADNRYFKKLYTADMDGDGDQDLVYTRKQGNSEIHFVKNNGDGTFTAPVLLISINSANLKCQLVDIDGDNNVDIVYNYDWSGTLPWLKNNGQGNFTPMASLTASSFTNFCFTDYTGDGLNDMIVTTSQGIKAYKNNGDTTFTVTETLDTTTSGTFITAADVDGDNDNDIIFLFSNSTTKKIQWCKNTNGVFDNAATLVNSITFNTPIVNDNIILLATDADADGKIDIFCGTPDKARLAWYKNLGNATFGSEQVVTLLSKGISDIALGDIDGDGKRDAVATASDMHKVAWYKNTGTGFTDENVVSRNAVYPRVASGDMDGDGDIDIVSVSADKVAWYKNINGNGNFDAERQIVVSNTITSPRNLKIADIDSDGDLDIIIDCGSPAVVNSDSVLFFKNDGQGNFTQEIVIAPTNFNTSYLADIDNDGDLDIITGPTAMKIRKNNGFGVFSAPESFDLGITYTFGATFLLEDIDNDGLTDMFYAGGTSGRFYKGTGNGQFAAVQTVTLPGNAVHALHDMDGDGDKDLVMAQMASNTIGWYRKVTTSPVFQFVGTLYSNISSNNAYMGVDVYDFDGDGDNDVIATSSGQHYLAWYENTGELNSLQPHDIVSDYAAANVNFAFADFNADGRMDIYTGSENDHSINWFKNLGPVRNRVAGTVRLDSDTNGCTAADAGVPQILVTLHDGLVTSSVFTNPGGAYSIAAAQGSYVTYVDVVPQNYSMPLWSQQSSFSENDGTIDTVDFCMTPTAQITDLEVSLFLTNDVRPGFPARYKVLAKNLGTVPVSGTLVVSFENGKLDFTTAAPAVTSQTANTLSFELGTITPLGNKEFNLTFTAKNIPVINLGDNVLLTANATVAGDATPDNNSATNTATVVGSYDPNDIAVREGSQILLEDADEYLHYLIRFQNTGNYYAERVVVKNPIDSKLDWTTMQLESMSHTGRTEIINGAEAVFTFDAIYLPASTVNEPASHGYIAYKIKPKANVVLGDTFTEQAHIFFDFNPAIDTNIVTTTVVDNAAGLPQFTAETVSVYPVPSKGLLTLKANSDIAKIDIYNQAGQRVASNISQNSIDISALSQGVYFAKIEDANGSTVTKKVVKN